VPPLMVIAGYLLGVPGGELMRTIRF